MRRAAEVRNVTILSVRAEWLILLNFAAIVSAHAAPAARSADPPVHAIDPQISAITLGVRDLQLS
jgi:hypothetical protein